MPSLSSCYWLTTLINPEFWCNVLSFLLMVYRIYWMLFRLNFADIGRRTRLAFVLSYSMVCSTWSMVLTIFSEFSLIMLNSWSVIFSSNCSNKACIPRERCCLFAWACYFAVSIEIFSISASLGTFRTCLLCNKNFSTLFLNRALVSYATNAFYPLQTPS